MLNVQKNSGSLKNVIDKMCLQIIFDIYALRGFGIE